MEKYSVIGKRVPRVDGVIKVTGVAKYTDDIVLPGMLYGKILRSPYPHAKILNVDVSKAKKMPGVKAVITGKDTPGIPYGVYPIFFIDDKYALAIDKVRFIGDEVAGVAARDEDIAEEALDLIKVDYEELPPVFDPEEAMGPNAPKIHDHAEKNIAVKFTWEFGNIEKAFNESYHVREDRFVTRPVAHCAMEPHAAICQFDLSGKLTVWLSTQDPDRNLRDIAKVLNIPEEKVRVIKPYVGGGFGGKITTIENALVAAFLSKETGKPVKIVCTREEVFSATRQRHPSIIDLKTGVKKDGTLLAQHCKVICDTGGYLGYGQIVTYLMGSFLIGNFKLENIKYEGYCVHTNKMNRGAMRGFGGPQISFAANSQLDMIAHDLGMEPVDLLLKNVFQPGDTTAHKWRITSCGARECIHEVSKHLNWEEKRRKPKENPPNKYRGLGIATSPAFHSGSNIDPHLAFSPTIKIHRDGAVTLFTGASDIGQGSDTVLCQVAAEGLGVPLESVTIVAADTAITPRVMGTYSSRITHAAGKAVMKAAAEARRQIFEVVSEKLEARMEDLEARDKRIYIKGSPEKGISFIEALNFCYLSNRLPIIATGRYNPIDDEVTLPDFWTGVGNVSPSYSFGASAAKVEVDIETGKVEIIKMAVAHDCGFAINPMGVEGQMEGSVEGGLGQAILEELKEDKGKVLNPSFLEYKMPTALDMPEVKPIIVETFAPEGPYGAKEGGEAIQISPAPAIVNAIYDAIGIRVKALPVTPEKVLRALERNKT